MIDGLSNYLDSKGMKSVNELRGRALPAYTEWGDLDLSYKVAAHIDPDKCIGCDLCYVACRDTSVHCIHVGEHPLPAGHRAPTRDAAIARAKDTGIHVTWVDWTSAPAATCARTSAPCPAASPWPTTRAARPSRAGTIASRRAPPRSRADCTTESGAIARRYSAESRQPEWRQLGLARVHAPD